MSSSATPSSATPATGAAPKAPRWLAIDALRGILVLFVVIFHAGLSYVAVDPWGFHEGNSMGAGLLMLVLRTFVMACFFMISGFASRGLLVRAGTKAFARDRALRIVLPFIVFLPIMRWSIGAMWHWGDSVMLAQDPTHQSSFEYGFDTYPFGQLWFLYIITLFYIVMLALRGPLGFLAPLTDRVLAVAVRSGLGPVLMAMPIGLLVLLNKSFEPWMGVPIPAEVPSVFAVVNYGSAFLLGWLLHRRQDLLPYIARYWHVTAVFAVLMTMAHIWTLFTLTGPYGSHRLLERLPIAGAFALACWTLNFAVLGGFLRFMSHPPAWTRYVTLTSFWLYLVHFPVTMALPILLFPLAIDPGLKFLLASAISLALLFLSYEVFVRHTFIGTWLNGPSKPKRTAPEAEKPTAGAAV